MQLHYEYWKCSCCGNLAVTYGVKIVDDATDYICAKCAISGCDNEYKFTKITKEAFMKEAGIEVNNVTL